MTLDEEGAQPLRARLREVTPDALEPIRALPGRHARAAPASALEKGLSRSTTRRHAVAPPRGLACCSRRRHPLAGWPPRTGPDCDVAPHGDVRRAASWRRRLLATRPKPTSRLASLARRETERSADAPVLLSAMTRVPPLLDVARPTRPAASSGGPEFPPTARRRPAPNWTSRVQASVRPSRAPHKELAGVYYRDVKTTDADGGACARTSSTWPPARPGSGPSGCR